MPSRYAESLGWLGALALLLAFSLTASKMLTTSSSGYLLLNLCGALGLAYASHKQRAYPAAVLNVIWAAVVVLSLGYRLA